MSEIVALVDRSGAVVGSAERSVVRRENLLHAATAVLVRDPAGRIYVHRRSPDKDWAPSAHDAAAGGVMAYGEEPAASAARELAEELGIDRRRRCARWGCRSTRTTRPAAWSTASRPPGTARSRHADGEVVWGAWMTLEELDERLADPAWPFVPDTRALLRPARARRRRRLRRPTLLGMSDDNSGPRASPPPRSWGCAHKVTRHGPVRSLEEAAAARGVEPRRS